ncbi:hypothetical protein QNI16_30860 [Cytophagaceae bacterium YF14B1]|uniref:Uncharacterized protein n=1 Tax=Xanthocytophaga flava TaxID=3048013 RepID=A0AAE3QU13_9BACT|nr:hypothetical protein [Xanthocytophaga flavus]MDJ1484941.1 hypothetical protein [Xanthocytophaga flavus]
MAQTYKQVVHSDSLVFSTRLWKEDTLGKYGYRIKAIQKGKILNKIKDGTIEEVEILLGDPDFCCVDNQEPAYIAYVYCYDFFRFVNKSNYKYQPRRDCDAPLDVELGSRVVILFDKRTKKVFEIGRAAVD